MLNKINTKATGLGGAALILIAVFSYPPFTGALLEAIAHPSVPSVVAVLSATAGCLAFLYSFPPIGVDHTGPP